MLQRIARLAIAAPRRIIGFAVFVFIAAGGLQLLIIISAGRTIANDISAIVP